MELVDLASLVDRQAQLLKVEIAKIGTEVAQIRPEISRLSVQNSNNAGGSFSVGQSMERAAYNLSLSITAFGEKFKQALIWTGVAFGVSLGVIMTLLLIVLLGKGIY
jgi:ElaB/YqjD/DUF883 family membrane-anchored ribosome-binding protein